jgi:uncharacterized protein (DUF2236 family)
MSSDADTGTRRPKPRELLADPIGPGSLTWTHFGDVRGLLYLGRAGTLQNMHPAVSGALQDHSNFFDNPLDRLFRSLPPIYGVVYDRRGHRHARSQLPHRSQRNRRNRRALPRPHS